MKLSVSIRPPRISIRSPQRQISSAGLAPTPGCTSTRCRSSPISIWPVEGRRRQRSPVIFLTGGDARHVVGEDEDADARPRGGGRRFLDRRVVVADIADPLLGHRLDQVLANHGVHQRSRSGGQRVEAVARHRVTGQHDRCAAVFDPESDGGRHRPMIRRRHRICTPLAIPDHTVGVFVHLAPAAVR